MVESKIVSHFATSTSITSVVSTRVYPMNLPAEGTYPAITYYRLNSERINHLQGYSSLEHPMITIESWATSYKAAKQLSTRVHSAMQLATGFSNVLISDVDGYNDALELYQVVQDYSCWNRE